VGKGDVLHDQDVKSGNARKVKIATNLACYTCRFRGKEENRGFEEMGKCAPSWDRESSFLLGVNTI
jgi:hypothetical protein